LDGRDEGLDGVYPLAGIGGLCFEFTGLGAGGFGFLIHLADARAKLFHVGHELFRTYFCQFREHGIGLRRGVRFLREGIAADYY
jgi:hypothetical protein